MSAFDQYANYLELWLVTNTTSKVGKLRAQYWQDIWGKKIIIFVQDCDFLFVGTIII